MQELALLTLEVARDHDVDDDAQIAASPTATAQRWDPLASDRQRLVGLRARRDLEQRVLLDRLARLGDEVDELVVVGEDRDRAGVVDYLALDLGAVGAPVAATRTGSPAAASAVATT